MKSESETNSPTLLVTGASGNLGRSVVEKLLTSHSATIIAGSRDPGKLADLETKGAITRTVDFDRPETLDAAFAGVDRLLLISTDSVFSPGQRLAQHRAAIAVAKKAGVKHIVYTSTVNAVEDSALLVAPDHLGTERALQESGIGHTILRNNYYADNLLPGLTGALKEGRWYSAAGDGRISYVTREDCAAVAAAALASDYEGRRTLDVTGAAALTVEEVAAIVREQTGQPLVVVPVPVQGLVDGMISHGLPEVLARLIASFDEAAAQGDLAVIAPTVEHLTGNVPTSLKDFLQGALQAQG